MKKFPLKTVSMFLSRFRKMMILLQNLFVEIQWFNSSENSSQIKFNAGNLKSNTDFSFN